MKRDVYFGFLKIQGEESERSLLAANNYAATLSELKRFEEAKALLGKVIPVARRVFGNNHESTLKMRWCCAMALYENKGATLDDLREAETTLEEMERTARRVFGGAHPIAVGIGHALERSREALRARETSCTCVPVPGA